MTEISAARVTSGPSSAITYRVGGREYPLITSRQCRVCFGAGTMIRTKAGFLPIETIESGDEVLASDGAWRKVRVAMSRQYDGKVYWLRSSTMSSSVMVTPEHPVWAMTSVHPRGGRCAPWRCGPDPQQGVNGLRHQMDWVDAQNLSCDSFVSTRILREDQAEDISSVEVPEWARGKKSRNGDFTISLTPDFLWAIGMYIAEGSAGAREINFALHEKEVEYADRLVRIFSDLGYGVTVRSREGHRGQWVVVSSSTLAEWFPVWMGSGSHNKRIPAELTNLPRPRVEHVWRGVMDGCGCYSTDTLYQTSEVLALQMAEIALRRGGVPKMASPRRLLPEGSSVYPLRRASSSPEDGRNHAGTWLTLGESLSQVREHRESIYSGLVYNLEVDGDPTYVVQNMLVHNCMSPYRFDIEEELIGGRTYKRIVDSLPEGHELTPRNVRDHYSNNHLPLEQAVTRQIVEARAQRVGKSIEDAAESLIDGITLAQVVVQKTFEAIASGDVTPDVKDGMGAAKFLSDLGEYDEGGTDMVAVSEAFMVYHEQAQEVMTPEQFERFGRLLTDNPVLKALAAKYDGEEVVEGEVVEGSQSLAGEFDRDGN